MYQIISIVNWKNSTFSIRAHDKLIPRILDRWEEMSPPGAQAFVAKLSDTKTSFTALFPSSEDILHDKQRIKFRRIVQSVIRDLVDDGKVEILEGEVVEMRTGSKNQKIITK